MTHQLGLHYLAIFAGVIGSALVSFVLLWAFFGNDDDGLFGDESWRAGRARTPLLALLWWLRNPFHNLTHYVIGFAGRTVEWDGPDMDSDGTFVAHAVYRGIRFPFFASNGGGWLRYIGWRPSGAFGIKFIYRRKQ